MKKWISHNQGICAGIVLSLLLIGWGYGCESRVPSPVSGSKVNRQELQHEVKFEIARLESEVAKLSDASTIALSTLERQDALKQRLFELASVMTETNAINPTGLITIAGTLLGLGFAVDNRIKDKVIKNRPINNTTIPKVN